MIGCSLLVGCGAYEVIDPVTGAVTTVSPAVEIGTAAYDAAREAVPTNPADITGWIGAGIAALLAAGATGAKVYMSKKRKR
jgi:hypothetical protein